MYDEPEYAHVTIGGYNYQDFGSDIEWYEMEYSYAQGWVLNITNITIDNTDLLVAPAASTTKPNGELKEGIYFGAGDEPLIASYAHFNSGYPFIGVDADVGQMIADELYFFRPDILCEENYYHNPWGICYLKEPCDDKTFTTNLTFALGSNATFNLPINTLLVNYTTEYYGEAWCGIMIQSMPNMYAFGNTETVTERHFYFGDIFFK